MLEKVIVEDERVKLSTGLLTHSPEEVEKIFAEAVEAGCEGVIVKSVGGGQRLPRRGPGLAVDQV
jgi:DNA ligase-1